MELNLHICWMLALEVIVVKWKSLHRLWSHVGVDRILSDQHGAIW